MDNIISLIPQRAPIIMVDKFLGIEANLSKTALTIKEDNIFVDGGCMSECGLIEHIAQSAASRIGYLFTKAGKPIPIGYIGSVNNFEIKEFPKVGETVSTTIEVIQEVLGITLIQAHCYINNVEIASCKMKIFLESNEK